MSFSGTTSAGAHFLEMAPNGGRPGGLMCTSRASFNGSERHASPWAFSSWTFERRLLCAAHALVGTFLCVVSGVLPRYWNQYLGHVGPAAVMFVLAELERCPGPGTIVAQGWTAIAGGASYLLYDLLIHGCSLNIFCHGHREQHHIAINTLFVLVGVDMVLHRSKFSAALVGIGFGLFVWLHPQPNPTGVLMHKFAGLMLALFAVARMCDRRDLCHVSLYYAAYLFFYGQNGFMDVYGGAEARGEAGSDGYVPARLAAIDPTAYALFVCSLATAMRTATETLDAAFGDGIVVAGGGGVGGWGKGRVRGGTAGVGTTGGFTAGGFTAGGFDAGEFAFETARLRDGFGGDDERGRRGD